MASEYISEKASLFYYSFRQVRTTYDGKEEYFAANKITIRKNKDFRNDGLQFVVYDQSDYGFKWNSDGIQKTSIDRDDSERIVFYGKGVDINRFGTFLSKKSLPEVAFATKGEKNILWYLNFYSEYNDDVFEISRPGVAEFIRSTSPMLQGTPYNPLQNTWQAIRAFVLSYYSKKYHMNQYDFPGVGTEEWNNKESTISMLDCVNLLSQLEGLCDSRVMEALRERQTGNMHMFKYKMEHMVDVIGTYYILYRTLL